MRIGIIGHGAIGRYVCERALDRGHRIRAILLRPERLSAAEPLPGGATAFVGAVAELPADIECMIDCAGHSALKSYGPDILRRGTDLITVSLGAFADPDCHDQLHRAATRGGAKLRLASGAIGALDCLRAARVGNLERVTYVGRKPPQGWRGSPADSRLDLDRLTHAEVHFDGSARDAAIQYPKNANVAAAVALAGLGFDQTRVQLIADPEVAENIHEVRAEGDFGRLVFEVRGRSLPDNPRSSALAAMSAVSALEQQSQVIVF